jgi:carotenoid cleavage dioxygenase
METQNIYLQGNFAPVDDEVTAFDLEVIGQIPVELEGGCVQQSGVRVGADRSHRRVVAE